MNNMNKLIWFKQMLRAFKHRLFSSVLFILVMTFISTVFLLFFSTPLVLKNSLKIKEELIYKNADIEISLGNNYEQRLFSLRPLQEVKGLKQITSLLVIPIHISNQQALLYFVDEKELNNFFPIAQDVLSYQQVLISTDLMMKEDNFITLSFQNHIYELEVKGSFEKQSIFSSVELPIILMDRRFAQEMIPLPGINNLANLVYLSVNKQVNLDDALNSVKNQYPNQEVKLTKSVDLDFEVKEISTMIRLISIIALMPVSLALYLLAKVNFTHIEKEMLVYKVCGMSPSKAYLHFSFVYLLYILIGYGVSLPIWYLITKQISFNYSGLNTFVFPHIIIVILISLLVVFAYIASFYTLFFINLNKVSYRQAESTKYHRQYRFLSKGFFLKITSFLVVLSSLYLVINYTVFSQLKIDASTHLIKGIIGIILSTIILVLIVFLLTSLWGLTKKSNLFSKVELKFIGLNRLQTWLNVAFVFMGISMSLAFFSINNFEKNITETNDTINFNLIIKNITINHAMYDQILSSYLEINMYEPGYCYQYVQINDYKEKIPLVISINPNDINLFFNLNISNKAINELKDLTALSIILSRDYQDIYGFKEGDFIELKINNNQSPTRYRVAGFSDQKVKLYAITNDFQNMNNKSTNEYNAIYLKTDDINYINDRLCAQLNGESISLVRVDSFFKVLMNIYMRSKKMMNLYVLTILICLALTLIIISWFMFIDKKKTYDIIYNMGATVKWFDTFKKTLIVSIISIPIIVVGTYLVGISFIHLARFSNTNFQMDQIITTIQMVSLCLIIFIFLIYYMERIIFIKMKNHIKYQKTN